MWRDEKVSDSTVIVVGVTVLNKVIYIYIDAFMAFFLLSCKMNIRDRVCSFRQTFFFQVNASGILVIAFPSKVCVRFRLKGKEFEARLGVWVKFTITTQRSLVCLCQSLFCVFISRIFGQVVIGNLD